MSIDQLLSTANLSRGAPRAVPAIGPRLRKLLWLVLALTSLLVANSVYLISITLLEFATGHTYQNFFYLAMFLLHIVVGLTLIGPVALFGVLHISNTHRRRNRRAVKSGYALFATSLTVLASGVLLMRVGGFDMKDPTVRAITYWIHIVSPLVVAWLYWLHRLVGPRIRWPAGVGVASSVVLFVGLMIPLHHQDPRLWNMVGPASGERYFFPSLARTSSGNFIPADQLMMDQYCLKCHKDSHQSWSQSAHHFASFNNPAYLASVRATRNAILKRDGDVQATRFCAGCHDPVPLFSGAFDDPQFDDVRHPSSQAGVTCTICHAITHINSNRGNADYTIEQPIHYPFTFSTAPLLRWVNEQLVKAKPELHKKTYLKPLHRTAEFCSVCHKVHLPEELNQYKWLRGQNHYDSFLLSGVSGHGARSFYYPAVAEKNCNRCHMPLQASNDFGARFFDKSGRLQVHDHLFPSANTALAYWHDRPDVIDRHRRFNRGVMRVDLMGVRRGGTIDGALDAPLRPHVPSLQPGGAYLLDTVIRTLKMGHHFTQGTADSNEVWLDITVTSGDRVIGRSGAIDEDGHVDRWAYFVNAFLLDRDGNRIARRNPEDIFVALYNHQIPPGAASTVHYRLDVPEDISAPITVEVALRYRKFDSPYLAFIARTRRAGDRPVRHLLPGRRPINRLPVMTLASDRVTFPIEGIDGRSIQQASPVPIWQRWNDYGIGFLLKGKRELRQAAEAFEQVERLGRYDGPLNLARVYFREGRLDEAVDAVNRAAAHDSPRAPAWTVAWLTAEINRQQGNLDAAERDLRSALLDDTAERRQRHFDFRQDYVVLNQLGQTLFDQAHRLRGKSRASKRAAKWREAVDVFRRVLTIDSENATAHYNLQLLYGLLGDTERSARHAALHAKYKIDDNARDRAVAAARRKYPAANHAAEQVAIYRIDPPMDADHGTARMADRSEARHRAEGDHE